MKKRTDDESNGAGAGPDHYDFSKVPSCFLAEVVSAPVGDALDWSGAYAVLTPENPHVYGRIALNATLGLRLREGGRYVCVKVLAPNEQDDDVYIYAIAEVDRYTTEELQAKYQPDPFDEPATQAQSEHPKGE